MADLLYLCHRIPYPPNKGDKIRSWHILEHLAARHRVHLGCFVDDPHDWRYVDRLREICADAHFARLSPRLARLRSLAGLLDGRPLTLAYYRDRGLARWIARVLAEARPEGIVAFSSAMAQFVMPGAGGAAAARRVIDFVDVDSEKWRAYAEKRRGLDRWIYAREARTLLAYERRVAAAFDASLFVSEAEAALFRRLAPETAARVGHMGNGVDCDYFSPAREYENPYWDEAGPVAVFTGAMDYWANVDAVCWFAETVFPLVQARVPGARFFIVGARPAPEVRRLGERDAAVVVTGRVPDVRPYLAHAAAVVAPLRIARGIQNKVLEAMAMAKATVATPEAAEGIAAEPEREILIADSSELFAEKLCRLFEEGDTGGVGERARARVAGSYGWAASLARLDEILEGAPASCDNDAQTGAQTAPPATGLGGARG